ncbi:MAG: YraN family protein [Candidatus Omnitrophica bacterium]|nr:YraN family protein [Candidatus Omnitrophota bacterium]
MSLYRLKLGKLAEEMAIRFLKKLGYKIIVRNYRCLFGEIDVIAKEGESIVFIEIKSRSSPLFGPPHLRVTRNKRRNIVKTACFYLKINSLLDANCRIDVVSVSLDKLKDPIELIRDAFHVDMWRY